MTVKRSRRAANGRSVYLGKGGRRHGRVTMGLKSDGTPDRRDVRGLTQAAVTAKVRARGAATREVVRGHQERKELGEYWED